MDGYNLNIGAGKELSTNGKMENITEHYENHLADCYSWLFGGLEENVKKNRDFFLSHSLLPQNSSIAVDLGAGSGFQSIPLSQIGYKVTSIDQCVKLLNELKDNSNGLHISIYKDNILNFQSHCQNNIELCICMGDTITRLDSKEEIQDLFQKVYQSLAVNGKFVLTFRDMNELKGLDRFIPVRSDDNTIFTCFLEYDDEKINVHDLIYKRVANKWSLSRSSYQKTRVSLDWIKDELNSCGFQFDFVELRKGLITIIAKKDIHRTRPRQNSLVGLANGLAGREGAENAKILDRITG